MMPIVAMRLHAYLRTYVVIAPTLAALVALALLYGGGKSRPEEAYGVSAMLIFVVLAWQVKILLDVEPDVQRRLVRVAAGSAHREIGAGVVAGAVTAAPTIGLALVLPWLLNGVGPVSAPGEPAPLPLAAALGVGLWAHLLALAPAVALGAWASRAVSRSAGRAVCVLAGGTVAALVLGLRSSPVPWLAPPLAETARMSSQGLTVGGVFGLTVWAAVWAAVVLAGYWWARVRRV
jgi:hypothetical protein